jgi:hypothetical protein
MSVSLSATTANPPDASQVREEAKPSLRKAWVVFARKRYDEPLCEIGTVTADEPRLAEVYARSIYDEQPWIEMAVVPRDQFRTVIAP